MSYKMEIYLHGQEEGAPGEKFVVPVDKDTTGDVVLRITPEDGKTPKVNKVQKKVCKKASKYLLLILVSGKCAG